jgi:hypothetical protein
VGQIFSLDVDIKATVQAVLDDLLVDNASGGFGKQCLLVYPPRLVACPNCLWDSVTNRSSNRPRSGAPIPFAPGGICPMCNAKGRSEQEVSENIVFKCTWDPKAFTYPLQNLDLTVPNSVVETKGYLTDLPKVMKASYIVVNLPMAPFVRQRFKLMGEPGDPSNIVQNRYMVAYWKQWNG